MAKKFSAAFSIHAIRSGTATTWTIQYAEPHYEKDTFPTREKAFLDASEKAEKDLKELQEMYNFDGVDLEVRINIREMRGG